MSEAVTVPKAKISIIIFLGLLAFGFAPILVRLATGVSPITLAAYRTIFAALLLLPFWVIHMKKEREEVPYTRKQKILGAFAGICLGFHFILWIASLKYTSVASASVLVTIHPIILIVIESTLFSKKFRGVTWIGVFMTFAGSALLGLADEHMMSVYPHPVFGDLLAVGAAIIFVIYILIGQNLRRQSTWLDYVSRVYSFAALSCIGVVLIAGVGFNITTVGILAALGMAIGPQILGHGSLNYAVKYISPTILSTLVLSEPLLATFFAYLIFSEIPTLFSAVSMTVIMAGILLTWKAKV
ncbi:MAG TPA: DMT family transporter [Balneolales bacterium]|nr:DMT family transporter [Balneolales bacterium]